MRCAVDTEEVGAVPDRWTDAVANAGNSTQELEAEPSRRRWLKMVGVSGAAAIAAQLPGRPAYAGHDTTNTFHLGEVNTAPGGVETSLLMDVDNDDGANALTLRNFGGGSALNAVGEGEGNAIQAVVNSASSAVVAFGGVVGFGHFVDELGPTGPGEGVVGQSEQPDKAGVLGESVLLIERGFEGQPPPFGIGVLGRTGAAPGVGVVGEAVVDEEVHQDFEGVEGTGVLGRSDSGVGVEGTSVTGTGVRASSGTGAALDVIGTAHFSTAGAATVPQGQNSTFVANTAVGTGSHITVTLTGNPGPRQLSWVQRDPGVGFTVHLTGAPPKQRPETPFTYLIVEPT